MSHPSATKIRTTGQAMCWLVIVLLCLPVARAQEPQQPPHDGDDSVELKARLVNVDVMVKDKKGNYITDLKAGDFVVVEDGEAQQLEFMDPPSVVEARVTTPGAVQPGAAPPATPAGLPRNIVSLLLDAQTTESTQMKSVADGALKYIRERVTTTDAVSVFRIGNGLQLLQPFTSDKAKLTAAVERGFGMGTSPYASDLASTNADIAATEGRLAATGSSGDPASAAGAQSNADAASALAAMVAQRTLAQYQKLRSQLSIQQSRPVIASLAAICEAQRGIPGKKVLVLFSEGFVTTSTQEWQVQSMIDIANRANVAIYIIDSGGLSAEGPSNNGPIVRSPLDSVSGLASQESRIRASGGENVFDNVRHEGLNREQEFLYRVSGDTGGAFIKNTNDFSKGLDRIDREVRARYTLGYYPTNSKFDGSFRKVKIEVKRPGVEVVTRPGYYAIANDELVPVLTGDDKKMFAGFDAAAAKPALPMFVELAPFRFKEGRFVVPLAVEIPSTGVKIDKKGDRRLMQLDIIAVVRNAANENLARMGGNFDMQLDEEQYQAVVANKIFFRQDVELEPGTYTVDLMVRDRLSGKVAAKRESLTLSPASDLSTSGIVLSRIVTPASGRGEAVDVLKTGNVLIRPTPSREFRTSDKLIIFFDLYNATTSAESGKAQVKVKVTLAKDGKQVMRPTQYMLTDVTADPVPHITFAKFLSLEGLSAGSYAATIEATDLATNKVMTKQTAFVVAQ